MTLSEVASNKITRVCPTKDGLPFWNRYAFVDLRVFDDGTVGPWAKAYDPCGKWACGLPVWEPMHIFTLSVKGQIGIGPNDQFEPYTPPSDMGSKFPGCPPVPEVVPLRPDPDNLNHIKLLQFRP